MNAIPEYQADLRFAVEVEYRALRDEILKRIELRQQHIALTLTIAGAFLGFGLTTAAVALVYPLLATFLAYGWAQNDVRIRQLAAYIRSHHEGVIPGLGWETYLQNKSPQAGFRNWRSPVILSHGGIFLLTQLMAIGIGLYRFTFTPIEWVLIGIDCVLAFLVARLLVKATRWQSTP
jgi:hypothetical protein